MQRYANVHMQMNWFPIEFNAKVMEYNPTICWNIDIEIWYLVGLSVCLSVNIIEHLLLTKVMHLSWNQHKIVVGCILPYAQKKIQTIRWTKLIISKLYCKFFSG